jgi:hypothetical protein
MTPIAWTEQFSYFAYLELDWLQPAPKHVDLQPNTSVGLDSVIGEECNAFQFRYATQTSIYSSGRGIWRRQNEGSVVQ